jgi:hypothetical protein
VKYQLSGLKEFIQLNFDNPVIGSTSFSAVAPKRLMIAARGEQLAATTVHYDITKRVQSSSQKNCSLTPQIYF